MEVLAGAIIHREVGVALGYQVDELGSLQARVDEVLHLRALAHLLVPLHYVQTAPQLLNVLLLDEVLYVHNHRTVDWRDRLFYAVSLLQDKALIAYVHHAERVFDRWNLNWDNYLVEHLKDGVALVGLILRVELGRLLVDQRGVHVVFGEVFVEAGGQEQYSQSQLPELGRSARFGLLLV